MDTVAAQAFCICETDDLFANFFCQTVAWENMSNNTLARTSSGNKFRLVIVQDEVEKGLIPDYFGNETQGPCNFLFQALLRIYKVKKMLNRCRRIFFTL